MSHRSNSDLVYRSRAVENCPGNTHLLCFDFEYNINVSYITYSSYCTGGQIATGAHLPQVHTTPTVTLPDEHIKSPIGPLVGSLFPNRWFLETTDLSLYLFFIYFSSLALTCKGCHRGSHRDSHLLCLAFFQRT